MEVLDKLQAVTHRFGAVVGAIVGDRPEEEFGDWPFVVAGHDNSCCIVFQCLLYDHVTSHVRCHNSICSLLVFKVYIRNLSWGAIA